MPEGEFNNATYIPGLNALGALVMWLKPGQLAFRFGQLKAAIEPVAIRIEKENQAMIDDHVLFDVEPAKDENDKRTADARPRKRRTKIGSSGATEYDFGTKADAYKKKLAELMDGKTSIVYTRLISEDDIAKIEKERRETKPKGPGGEVIELPPVDFSALIPFMEPTKEVAPAKEASAEADRV